MILAIQCVLAQEIETKVNTGHIVPEKMLVFDVNKSETLLATYGSDNKIIIWDIITGRELLSILSPTTNLTKQNPFFWSDKELVYYSNNKIFLYDISLRKITKTISPEQPIFFVIKAGEKIASSHLNGDIDIWNLNSGDVEHIWKPFPATLVEKEYLYNIGYLNNSDKVVAGIGESIAALMLSNKSESNATVEAPFKNRPYYMKTDERNIYYQDGDKDFVDKLYQYNSNLKYVNEFTIYPHSSTLPFDVNSTTGASALLERSSSVLKIKQAWANQGHTKKHRLSFEPYGSRGRIETMGFVGKSYFLTANHENEIKIWDLLGSNRKVKFPTLGDMAAPDNFIVEARNLKPEVKGSHFAKRIKDTNSLLVWHYSSMFSKESPVYLLNLDDLTFREVASDIEIGIRKKQFTRRSVNFVGNEPYFEAISNGGKSSYQPLNDQKVTLELRRSFFRVKYIDDRKEVIKLSMDKIRKFGLNKNDVQHDYPIRDGLITKGYENIFVSFRNYLLGFDLGNTLKTRVANSIRPDQNTLNREYFDPQSATMISPEGVYITSMFEVNKKIVVGDDRGNLSIFDPKSGKVIHKGLSLEFYIHAIAPFNDNLAMISTEESIALLDVNTYKIVAKIYLEDEGTGLSIVTSDGYYASNKKSVGNLLHYVKGENVYTFDQFDLQFNRPDIVYERIGYKSKSLLNTYKKAWEKRVRKMGFDPRDFEGDQSLHVPELHLVSKPSFYEETTSPMYNVSLKASDSKFKLERLFVQVNGVPIDGYMGESLRHLNTQTLEKEVTLSLSEGKNIIKIAVMNEKGVVSLTKRFEVKYKKSSSSKPDLHLVVIGVSKFQQSEFNLTFADKDAKDIVSQFKSKKDSFGTINTYELTNEKATVENVMALRKHLEQTNTDDQVILFVASHGLLDDSLDYYIAMHDVDFANPKNKGLKYEQLEHLLDDIPARKKLMLLDACHSGEVDKSESQIITASSETVEGVSSRGFTRVKSKRSDANIDLKSRFQLMKELFADLRRNNGAIVISSASGQEFAFESEAWQNGVFTYAFLEGLQSGNADQNDDKAISVSEIMDYVGKRVVKLTNGKQNPTSRAENIDQDFRLW